LPGVIMVGAPVACELAGNGEVFKTSLTSTRFLAFLKSIQHFHQKWIIPSGSKHPLTSIFDMGDSRCARKPKKKKVSGIEPGSLKLHGLLFNNILSGKGCRLSLLFSYKVSFCALFQKRSAVLRAFHTSFLRALRFARFFKSAVPM